ncbi:MULTISPECIES: glycosyltransferase family 39 protein [unclassified Coleofasciculus]|uniref:glycosyltransferase family 39 protein n=1 Tax=unclassified Coleofasciculus TaxID=2692782 RepID=UPI001880CE04|nr:MULTISPECIES: glycosyltransferase family 39 protein [unclassified Coleofasciculus]MBE9125739.1 glycosyltransferase family 39 protein [Coleofasciculus sp. LEGE 07081]MBE9147227.1 glycosyltransferase family 39 protein [Coleofasciculus sp. LEGE 07092]
MKFLKLLPQIRVRYLIIIVLVLGVFFRFVNLEQKFYWYDEVYTSLRVSGYTSTEVIQDLLDGHVISIEELQKYQHPNSDKGVIDTVKGLAIEETQLPPLYFLMTRFWVQLLGHSVAVTRSLSALLSLLVFPCLYWLCRELFEFPLVGWVAITLMAVSPFHVLYAQEARMYSLWTVTILLSSAALLRAVRVNTKGSWGLYSVTLALGLYTHLLSVLVAIAHVIYIAVIERFKLSKVARAYLFASLGGFLIFSPWLLVVIIHFYGTGGVTGWTGNSLSLLTLVKIWILGISRVFFDVDLDSVIEQYAIGLGLGNNSAVKEVFANSVLLISVSIILLVLGLIAYSLYFLCRQSPKRVWLFILTLGGVTALSKILPDLIWGGQRSAVSRYLIPCYLSLQLAVAYLLASKISTIYAGTRQQKLWRVATIALISSGVLSCAVISQAEAWWNRPGSPYHYPARLINQTANPLLVSDAVINWSTSSSHLLDPDINLVIGFSYLLGQNVRFQFVFEPQIPQIPEEVRDVFFFSPSKTLRSGLIQEYKHKIEPIYKPGDIWYFEKLE